MTLRRRAQELIGKYRKLSVPMKASLWFAICNILQKGIQFITVPMFTRLMSASDYGRYSVFLSWYQIISIFATLNMWNYVLNNGMLKFENDRTGYLSSLQGLSGMISFGLFLIYLPFSGLWEKATSLSLAAMGMMFVELLLMPSYEYWCARERFEFRYKGVVTLTLTVTAAIPLVSIPLVLLSEDKGMAAIAGRTITSAVVFVVPALLIIKKGRKFFDKSYWKFALRFNLPLIPHFLSLVVLNQSDRIMISRMVGDDKAGIYSVAYSAAMVIQLFNGAILATLIPYTYNSLKENKFEGIRRGANFLLALIAGLNLALICVAPEAIKLLGPEEYHEAMYIIPPVALSGLFTFLFNLFANIEYYFEETKFVAMASTGSAVMNVVLNAICIPRFGYIAAGYTTLACYMLYSLGHYVFMCVVAKKHMNGRKVYNIKVILVIILGSLACGFSLLALYDHPILRYAIVLCAVAVCLVKSKTILNDLKTLKISKE